MLLRNSVGQLSAAAIIKNTVAAPGELNIGDIIPGEFLVELKKDAELDVWKHSQWAETIHEKSMTNPGNYTGLEEILKYSDYEGYVGSYEDATVEQIKNHPDTKSVIQVIHRGNDTTPEGSAEAEPHETLADGGPSDMDLGKADIAVLSYKNGPPKEMKEDEPDEAMHDDEKKKKAKMAKWSNKAMAEKKKKKKIEKERLEKEKEKLLTEEEKLEKVEERMKKKAKDMKKFGQTLAMLPLVCVVL